MNFQISNHIEEYTSYKYQYEDKTLFYGYWNKLFCSVQKYIPSNIHPNIITISGLLIMFITNFLGNFFENRFIFSFGIIYYLLSDGVDGIHARKTEQTSIIGEYLDHIGDSVVCGLVADQFLDSVGFQNDLMKKNMVLFSSLYFTKPHFHSIKSKKMVFNYYEDSSLLLTLCSIINILRPNIFDFTQLIFNFINNYFYGIIGKLVSKNFFDFVIFSLPTIYLYLDTLKSIVKNKMNDDYLILNKNDAINSYIYVSYFLLKLFILVCDINSFSSVHFIDSFLMFSLINSKIFGSQIDYKIIIFMILFLMTPVTTSMMTIFLTYYLIFYISKKLKIKIM
jgi:hypothetical protein